MFRIIIRNIHSSVQSCGQSATTSNRQVKIMNKLLFGKNKGKRGWYNAGPSTLSSAKTLSNPVGVQKHTSRRITVLNSLFMKNITDLMATGAMADSIAGLGIEISRVKVAQDFATISVYWLANGSAQDEPIEALLRTASGHLRHELSQLRVMGEVPRIHFVKDAEFALYVEVERILKGADMGSPAGEGDDGVLSDPQQEIELQQVPEMRHDVLGLNHSFILGKITNKLKMRDQYKASSSSSNTACEGSSDEKMPPTDLDGVWDAKRLQTLDREDRFAEFLKSKRMGKTRNAVNRADREYLLEEQRGRVGSSVGSGEEYQDLDEERDTIDEEEFNPRGR